MATLLPCLRLSFDKRTGQGFFLRAESLFDAATYIDNIGVTNSYGGLSLHERSHGETFLTVLEQKFQRNGLFLLDEPEAALSPQRQLPFLVLLHDTLRKHKDAQSIISSHLPLLLGYPEGQILSFDDRKIPRLFPREEWKKCGVSAPGPVHGDNCMLTFSAVGRLFSRGV